jgi:c-di-GMP-binding flagellar brake protein YcgR
MDFTDVLKIGELMEIESDGLRARTKLEELSMEGDLIVMQPTVRGIPLRSRPDEPAKFSFCRQDGVYMFDALMLSSFMRGNVRLCRCKPVSEVMKIQRREYYRLPIALDVIMEKREEKDGVSKRCRAKTVDLSENAVQLTCFTGYEQGAGFNLEIRLSEKEIIGVEGKVLRCVPPLDKKDPYSIVLVFEELSPRVRVRLRRYILKQQVARRKKDINELS